MLLARGKILKKRKVNPNEITEDHYNSNRKRPSAGLTCADFFHGKVVEGHCVPNRSLKQGNITTGIREDTKVEVKPPHSHQRTNLPSNQRLHRLSIPGITDSTEGSTKLGEKLDFNQRSSITPNSITKSSVRKLTWSTLKRVLLPFLTESELMSIHQLTRGKVVQVFFRNVMLR